MQEKEEENNSCDNKDTPDVVWQDENQIKIVVQFHPELGQNEHVTIIIIIMGTSSYAKDGVALFYKT